MSTFNGNQYVQTLSDRPGVYIMFDDKSQYLYVGKARDLKKRVASYFRDPAMLPPKTRVMVKKIHRMDIIETETESEALLLESNLIKTQKPRYNILLRDNKSYPYIVIDTSHPFPRLDLYRGKKKKGMQFYGPYPSASSVRQTLSLLQKLFQVRLCENSYYSHRTRPCLQYQIKRCTAPCVGMVSEDEYAEQIRWVELFLNGKSNDLINALTVTMHEHAEALAFEKAAEARNLINDLRHIMQQQNVESGNQNLDIFGFAFGASKLTICVTFVRTGRVVGDKRFVLEEALLQSPVDAFTQLIMQFYSNKPVPSEVILPSLQDAKAILRSIQGKDEREEDTEYEWEIMQDSLIISLSKIAGKQVQVKSSVRGIREKWQQTSLNSARLHLQQNEENQHRHSEAFRRIQYFFGLPALPQKMACIDISHMMGKQTYGSFVVMNHQGTVKNEYRAYKMKDIIAGDDYAAIKQTVSRAIIHMRKNEMQLPDILFIDGGKGQLTSAAEAVAELKEDYPQVLQMQLISIAKGRERKEGKELFLRLDDNNRFTEKPFDVTDKSLHLVQQLRNEAHRFAISKHRKARGKQLVSSVLNDIPGIGAQKKQALIDYFGGLQGVKKASIAELNQVSGISEKLAQTIYHYLH